MKNQKIWANAIASRITDEMDIKDSFPEDALLLEKTLVKLFLLRPSCMKKIIGTGIIEDDYFAHLD